MDNTNSPPAYIRWGDIPLSPYEQLLEDARSLNKLVQLAISAGQITDHPFNTAHADSTAHAHATSAPAMVPGTLPHTVPAPLTVQETAPVHRAGNLPGMPAGTEPGNTVVTAKRGRGRPRTFESKYPVGDPRRKAESVARSRAKRRAGGEVVFDITQVGLMVKQGAGDHIIGSPLADLWFRIVAANGEMQKHINAARYEQDILDTLCAEYEAQYPLGKVQK